MAFQVLDRVQETTTTTGTGTITLAGAVSGFQSFFNAGLNNGDTTYYCVTSGTAWEVGLGTFSTGPNAIARTTILASSASGSAITLAGTSNVFCVYPAGKSVYRDSSGNVAGYNLTAGTINSTTVGATSASTGAFTTLSANSTVSGAGFTAYLASPPAIGGTVAAAGTFTTVVANTSAGIGAIAPAGINFYNAKNITGSTTANANVTQATVQSDVTTVGRGYATVLATAATAFTTSIQHFYANQSTIGAGSTVNSQYGFISESNLIGATNNYAFFANNTAAVTAGKTAFGFYSAVNTATGGGTTYAFYAAGTAPNVFTGTVSIGGTAAPTKFNVRVDSSGAVSDVMLLQNNTSSVVNTGVALYFDPNGNGVSRAASIQSVQSTVGNYADIRFFTAAGGAPTEKMRIEAGGNVGIGKVPSTALDVNGTVTATTVTGKLTPPAGTATAGTAPLKFTSGTNLTTAEAGAMEYDGENLFFSAEANQRGVVAAPQFVILTSNYTTPLGTADVLKQAFNATTNGALTLTTGSYLFECLLNISGMSGTSGTLEFGFGGTALGRFRYIALANKAAASTTAANTTFSSSAAVTVITPATTATVGYALIQGSIVVTTAGTIIPSIALSVAAACTVVSGSYFILTPIGSSTVQTVGNWS